MKLRAVARAGTLGALMMACNPVETAREWGKAARPQRAVPTPAAVPAAPTSRTVRDDEPARLEWARRNTLGAYDRVGLRDPKWDAGARKLIEDSLPWFAALDRAVTPAEERMQQGRRVVESGCSDPLVLYFYAVAWDAFDGDSREAAVLFDRALDGMNTVPYSRAVARHVVGQIYSEYQKNAQGFGSAARLAPLEPRWFAESLSDGSYLPDEDVVLVWQLMDGTGESFFKRNRSAAVAALEAAPWVDPWVRLLLSGNRHWQDAWDARGTGWSHEVDPDRKKTFAEKAAFARRDLVEAWRLRPDRPEAAGEMVVVSEDSPGEGESARLWFDRAVAAQMDYLPAYTSMLRRMTPRWGGSYEEMLDFGRECLANGRFDTYVPLVLSDAVRRIEMDQRDEVGGAGGTPIYSDPETFRLLSKMLDGYLAEPSRAWERHRFEDRYAVVAAKAGRYDTARDHLERAGFRFDLDLQSLLKERSAAFVARAAALGGPAAKVVEQGEAAWNAFDIAKARAAYLEAQRKDKAPPAARLFRDRLAALSLEEELARGGWVAFLPRSDDLAGFEPLLGKWKRESDGALLGTTGVKGMLLNALARVGPDCEVRGILEMVSSTNGEHQGGVVLGHPDFGAKDWFSLRLQNLRREGPLAAISRHFYIWEGVAKFDLKDANEFLLRSWQGKLSAMVNGVVVHEFTPRGEFLKGRDVLVGFGGYFDLNQYSVRFRRVEVRRLTAQPPPLG